MDTHCLAQVVVPLPGPVFGCTQAGQHSSHLDPCALLVLFLRIVVHHCLGGVPFLCSLHSRATMLVVPYKNGAPVQFAKPISKYIKSQYSKVGCHCCAAGWVRS